MIQLYRTTEMEQSALMLAKHFSHVLVRGFSALDNPIRIRTNALGDNVYLGRNADFGDRDIKRWFANGGILVNHTYLPKEMPHEAQLLCEAPLSADELEKIVEQTTRIAVIYQRPSWDEHRRAIARLNPQPIPCKMLHTLIHSGVVESDQIAICNALNIPHTSIGAFHDDSLCAVIKIVPSELKRVRKFTFPGGMEKTYFPVTRLVPLVKPEDKSLLALYQHIERLPEAAGVRLALGNVLNQSARFWKSSLRALVRGGSVDQLPSVTFYKTDTPEPNYEKILARHHQAQAELAMMIDMVEGLRKFTSQAARAVASRPAPAAIAGLSQSRFVSSRGSSARSRGTAR